MPRITGRATRLTDDLAERLYQRLWAGQAIDALCAEPPWPSKTTFYRWRREHPAFDQNVAALLAQRPAGPNPQPRRGRVSYSPERAEQVLARLAAGESQRQIARDPAMPCVMTLLAWSRDVPEFGARRRSILRRRPPPRQTRRFTRWSEALSERICLRILYGESLEAICRDLAMPASATVRRWLRERPWFKRDYEMAVEERWHLRTDREFERRMARAG